MTTTAARPAKSEPVLTRSQMLKELDPKVKESVIKANAKTKAMLLDAFRFGRAGLFK